MLVKTITAGTSESFQLNYVPQYLLLRGDDSQDLRGKVAAKVTVLGDGVICDLDNVGVSAVGSFLQYHNGAGQSQTPILVVPLADGVIPQKTTDITVDATASASDVRVYAPVAAKGSMYVQSLQQTVLANSQTKFSDFTMIALSEANDDCQFTVNYHDGANHTYSGEEVRNLSVLFQAGLQTVFPNLKQNVKEVYVLSPNEIKAYLMRFRKVENL